jgi:hypothetical protein
LARQSRDIDNSLNQILFNQGWIPRCTWLSLAVNKSKGKCKVDSTENNGHAFVISIIESQYPRIVEERQKIVNAAFLP